MKRNIFLLIVFILFSQSSSAQRTIKSTEAFTVSGKVKNTKTFTLAELDTFPVVEINSKVVCNQKGEVKDTIKAMKGILLKSVLASVEYDYEKPKQLNEFYFVCIASDGYKAVFSWNEIYNTEVGNNLFIVTEMDGRKLKVMDERILLISASDLQTGRRFIKALAKIEVKKTE